MLLVLIIISFMKSILYAKIMLSQKFFLYKIYSLCKNNAISKVCFYKIYSLCKNNAISKVLNKLQVFHFRCTVHTNTTPTVITH